MIIEADGVRLPVEDGMFGPEVRTRDPDADAFGFVLNNAARGVLPDLRERLERGEGAARGDVFVARPDPSDDLDGPRDRWKRLSGRDPGDDVYLIGVAGLGNVVLVPRLTLLSLYEQLEAVRRAKGATESVAATPVQRDRADTLDRELEDLERDAREVDELDTAGRTIDERATVAAKRRVLLLCLANAGVFDGKASEAVSRLGLATLASYADAATKLRAYFGSAARLRYLPPLELERPYSAPVSLDWFRRPAPVPEGFERDGWLAYCEYGFAMMMATLEGGEGDLYTGGGGRTVRLFWRKDDGRTPALVAAKAGR